MSGASRQEAKWNISSREKELFLQDMDCEKNMICAICKIGQTKSGTATLLLGRDNSLVVIKDVPAHICENCGEQFFDAEITREVMQKAEESVQKGAELEVLRMVA